MSQYVRTFKPDVGTCFSNKMVFFMLKTTTKGGSKILYIKFFRTPLLLLLAICELFKIVSLPNTVISIDLTFFINTVNSD